MSTMNLNFLLPLLPVLVLSVNPRLKDNYLEMHCPKSNPPSSHFFVHQSVTPQGNLSAGQYNRINARTLLECTKACCVKESCDVAFFFDSSCFHIHCKSSELCKPLVRTGKKFKHSYMIQVRDADLRSSSDTWSQKSSELQPKELMFHLDDKKPLKTGENTSYDYKTSLKATTASSKGPVRPTQKKTCTYGIDEDCAINEHCVVYNNRARQGFCECDDGYTRSESTGECQLLTTKSGLNVTATPSLLPTNVTNVQNSSQPATTPSSEYENKVTGNKKSSSTSAPIERHLVVSAGGNKVIQLPDNEVTLSAYALPQENTGVKYSYLWTLLSQPGGDEEAGIMQGQTSPTLKLSKLRSGVYMFEISVTGNGSSGKDTVNVTVLPPKRTNKPPVAVIQPSNVTVKLPNKDTVLDGSYSTDDDKIIDYHWEVISLPIGYKIQLNNSSTVQLRNLIPGFYRFKLTVKDSDGILNYTFANVTVLKEKDYPPTANAGSDAVMYLPQDDVTLNGNLSSDDKGIKSYQWVKSPETDKSVDMEGTNSPYLHLSHLEVGVYKFILKVTDTSDQTSEAEVHVFVKPESNIPPKAVAGEDINVSLPLDKPVTLDGKKSSDGIKIMKWNWKQVNGPKPASIENGNTSTAQVSRLVPGEYVFKLTVCDDKGQNTSDEVKVIVTQ
ncbi:dyslexia-associated protein KIAA0319-like protein, partial [Limulus polyphemus]|uniref:Dyslexia-associated protein KIAA0319-like protein n=1 Tax=Limulus polyphemus TaxID=6850 RepID=A0ABM1TR96_LIMPO